MQRSGDSDDSVLSEGAIDHTKAEEAEGEFSLYSLFKRGLLTDCILVVPREKKVRVEEEGEEDEEEEEGNSGDFKLHKLVLNSDNLVKAGDERSRSWHLIADTATRR